MADFNEQLPQWDATGVEPPSSKKTDGWAVNDKPPAGWLNWLFNRIYKTILEIRTVLSAQKAKLDAASAVLTVNTLIKRDSNGRAQVAAPVAAADIARKDTVDAAQAAAVAASVPISQKGEADGVATLDGDTKLPAAQLPNSSVQATTVDLTYYVRTDGNDNNTGLSNTAGGAFKTIGKAVSMVPQIVNHAVTINVASGTYAEAVTLNGFVTKKTGLSIVATGTVNVTSFSVSNCYGLVQVTGFSAITTTADAFTTSCSGRVVFTSCSATGTSSSFAAFFAGTSNVYFDSCTASNHAIGVGALAESMVYASNTSGTGNAAAYVSGFASYFGYAGSVPAGGMVAQDGGTLVSGSGVLNPWGDNTQQLRPLGEMTRGINQTTQTVTANVWTKVLWTGVISNQKGAVDLSGSRFVAPEAGVYLVSHRLGLDIQSSSNIENAKTMLYLNGSQNASFGEVDIRNSATSGQISSAAHIFLGAGAVVEFYVYVSATATISNATASTHAAIVRVA